MIGYPHVSQYNPNKSFVNKKKFIKFSVFFSAKISIAIISKRQKCTYVTTQKQRRYIDVYNCHLEYRPRDRHFGRATVVFGATFVFS